MEIIEKEIKRKIETSISTPRYLKPNWMQFQCKTTFIICLGMTYGYIYYEYDRLGAGTAGNYFEGL